MNPLPFHTRKVDSIFSQIRQELKDFYEQSISVVPGYSFNQYDTLKRIHLYLNSKYENGGTYLGRDLLFYNIITSPCEVATRMLNIDTKNIRLWPTNPKSHFSTWLLEKELKLWLKTSKMGKILNQIAEEAPKYGSIVLEKTKDGATVVDLRRLVNDQTVDNITDSRFVTTIHYMTPTQLRETGWDNVDLAIELFGNPNLQEPFEDEYGNLHQMQSTPYIKVIKRYGERPAHELDTKLKPGTKAGDKLVRCLFIVTGCDFLNKDAEGKILGEMGLVLFKSKWHKAWPFKDFHYTKVKGRYLGLGIPEMLFDVQMRMNELKNSKRFSMELTDMVLLQTKDKSIMRNALTDLQNGDILNYTNGDGITQIAIDDRNYAGHKDEEASYSMQADRLSFAYEAVRGEPMPASTPATNALLASQSATSVYAFKRENLSLFLQDFFNDLVMPQLMKDLTPQHIMRFVGNSQELQKIDMAAAEIVANDFIKDSLINGRIFTPEELESVKQNAIEEYKKLGEQRFIKVKDAFYDDAEFEFDFIVGNEQEDPGTIAQNTQFMLANYNAEAMNDPLYKVVYFKMAQSMGVSPAELEFAEQQRADMPQPEAVLPPNPQPNGTTTPSGILPPLTAGGQ